MYETSVLVVVTVILSSFVTGMVFIGFAEIIKLLVKINHNAYVAAKNLKARDEN